MILLKSAILEGIQNGDIHVSPFNPDNVGPNSIDLTLSNKLYVYTGSFLDMNDVNPVEELIIPETGLFLQPGEFYLGATNECATSKKYVPFIEGRSSAARLGITVHLASGVGDIGFAYDENLECTGALWTLEITVEKKIRVYPNRRICQVIFLEGIGPIDNNYYRGKYSHQMLPQPSLMFKDNELQGHLNGN